MNNISDLRSFRIFHQVPYEDLVQLRQLCHFRRAAPGEALMEESDCSRRVFFIVRGRVKVAVDDENGEEIVLGVWGAGEPLGEMSAVDDGNYLARVVALDPCELLWMSREDFRHCLQVIPFLSLNVACVLARHIRKATLQIQALSTQDTTLRVIHNLLWLDESEAAKTKDGFLPVTQGELATMCSCSRMQLHRVLDEVVEAGLVERGHRGLCVLDRDALLLWGRAWRKRPRERENKDAAKINRKIF